MSTLPQAIRTVKTPTLPPDEDERSVERARRALARLRQQMETLESVTDPDVLEEADGALADVLWGLTHPQPAELAPRDCGFVSRSTAEMLASGAWRFQS